ncbi:MAG TPA: hypothetical protein VMG10_28845 [Gemmataceae bacterium]|nr:hypothetical protein [Gemmataceae bacterium]
MSWPLSQDYNEAIQDPRNNFSDAELKKGEAVSNALSIPLPRSGNTARRRGVGDRPAAGIASPCRCQAGGFDENKRSKRPGIRRAKTRDFPPFW